MIANTESTAKKQENRINLWIRLSKQIDRPHQKLLVHVKNFLNMSDSMIANTEEV